MILIPQRLFEDQRVTTIMRDGNVCILSKDLSEPIVKREGYISNHVISVLLEGEQQIRTYDDTLITVKTNEILFIPRGMYYISDLVPKNGVFRSILFYFDDRIIQEFLSTSRVTEISRDSVPDHLKFGVLPVITRFTESLVDIYQNNRLKNKNFLDLKILELLNLLNGLSKEQQFANFLFRLTLPKKRHIKSFMERNFDKPLKVEDYAYLTGRSLSSFRRDFRSYFDITPQKWLRDKRLEKAVAILKEKDISVTELAFETGYENISYFIKAFKKKYGQSPKQYILNVHRNRLQ